MCQSFGLRGLGVALEWAGESELQNARAPWQTTPVRLFNGPWPVFPVLDGLHGLSTECGLFRLSPAVCGEPITRSSQLASTEQEPT